MSDEEKRAEKRTRLQASREALVRQHTSLTEQLTQTTVGIHQIDGAISILNELDADAASIAAEPAHLNGAATVAADA